MKDFLTAFRTELLKTNRTLTLALAFLTPLALGFLELVIGYQYGARQYPPGADNWPKLAEHYLIMWSLLMLPLFVTLEMGLLGAVEHGNHTWKQLYASPVKRPAIYLAKQIIGLLVVGLSTAIGVVLVVLVGLAFRYLLPDLGFDTPIPWQTIGVSYSLSYLAAWLIIAFHFWVSMRWPSFVLAMSVGIVATIAGVLVISSDWALVYPWTMPGQVGLDMLKDQITWLPVLLGFFGGFVVCGLGCWEVTRRDILS